MDLLQDKNAVYLFTAYGVFIGGISIYVLTLWLRRRSLDREEEEIRRVEEENAKQ
jgi:hypothetical protein